MSLIPVTNTPVLSNFPEDLVLLITDCVDDPSEALTLLQEGNVSSDLWLHRLQQRVSLNYAGIRNYAHIFKCSFYLPLSSVVMDLRERAWHIMTSGAFNLGNPIELGCYFHGESKVECNSICSNSIRDIEYIARDWGSRRLDDPLMISKSVLATSIFEILRKAIDANDINLVKRVVRSSIGMGILHKYNLQAKRLVLYAVEKNREDMLHQILKMTLIEGGISINTVGDGNDSLDNPNLKLSCFRIAVSGMIKYKLFPLIQTFLKEKHVGFEKEKADMQKMLAKHNRRTEAPIKYNLSLLSTLDFAANPTSFATAYLEEQLRLPYNTGDKLFLALSTSFYLPTSPRVLAIQGKAFSVLLSGKFHLSNSHTEPDMSRCLLHERNIVECPVLPSPFSCSRLREHIRDRLTDRRPFSMSQYLLITSIFQVAKRAIDVNAIAVIKRLLASAEVNHILAHNSYLAAALCLYALEKECSEFFSEVVKIQDLHQNLERIISDLSEGNGQMRNRLLAVLVAAVIKNRQFSLFEEVLTLVKAANTLPGQQIVIDRLEGLLASHKAQRGLSFKQEEKKE